VAALQPVRIGPVEQERTGHPSRRSRICSAPWRQPSPPRTSSGRVPAPWVC